MRQYLIEMRMTSRFSEDSTRPPYNSMQCPAHYEWSSLDFEFGPFWTSTTFSGQRHKVDFEFSHFYIACSTEGIRSTQ